MGRNTVKRIIFLLTVLLSVNTFAQEALEAGPFSKLHFAIYSGAAVTSAPKTGVSFMVEGKTEILPRLNAKVSVGYYKLGENDFQLIKTYRRLNVDNVVSYQTHTYNIEGYDYSVFPISAGFEYAIAEGSVSPCLILEGGSNSYSVASRCSNNVFGETGKYLSADDVPAEYKDCILKDKSKRSYRAAFGMGARISLWKGVNLEIRYMYNINTNMTNNHQILAGVSL